VKVKPILVGSVPRLESVGVTGWSYSSAPITVVLMILTSGGSNNVVTPVKYKESKYLEVKGQGHNDFILICHSWSFPNNIHTKYGSCTIKNHLINLVVKGQGDLFLISYTLTMS